MCPHAAAQALSAMTENERRLACQTDPDYGR